jgi:DNA-binding MarR family transcriptional regulator
MNNSILEFPGDNIRSLLERVSIGLDMRVEEYRNGTPYASARPSDVKIFVLAVLKPRTMSELARLSNVSRQAIHSSIKRLMKMGVVALEPAPGNQRDKLVVITERGKVARTVGIQIVHRFEGECSAVIGADGLTQLRELLTALDQAIGRDAGVNAAVLAQRGKDAEKSTKQSA